MQVGTLRYAGNGGFTARGDGFWTVDAVGPCELQDAMLERDKSGPVIHAEIWARDPANAGGFLLSDGVGFAVYPYGFPDPPVRAIMRPQIRSCPSLAGLSELAALGVLLSSPNASAYIPPLSTSSG